MKNIIIFILFFISFNAYSQKTIITEFKLKNGWTVRGNIIDSIPNKSYTIKTLKGVEQSYSLDEIEKISRITTGKDKVDYIPKGKFSANIDLGLQDFSNKLYEDGNRKLGSNVIGKLFGVSANYILFKNLELGLSYFIFNRNVENYDSEYSTSGGVSRKYLEKINSDMRQYSLNLVKYFTSYKIKPFLSVSLGYNNTINNTTSYKESNGVIDVTDSRPNFNYNFFSVYPGIGVVYFLNRNFSLSTLYLLTSISSQPGFLIYTTEITDVITNGIYICRLKYTFIK